MISETSMTIGTDYEGEDPLGWFVTEKLRGVRALWDGSRFWTRGGFTVAAPAWFTAALPKLFLDGEIYAGRCPVETVARLAVQHNRWIEGVHTFQVFDCPTAAGDYRQRLRQAARAVRGCPHARAVRVGVIKDRREVFSRLQAVQGQSGEGLMLRHPGVTSYETGRTKNLLKVKGAHPAMFTLEFTRVRPVPLPKLSSCQNPRPLV